jgi:hypothetical protein
MVFENEKYLIAGTPTSSPAIPTNHRLYDSSYSNGAKAGQQSDEHSRAAIKRIDMWRMPQNAIP